MQERFIEFQVELASINLAQYTEKALKKWKKDWDKYVEKGGVRPGRPI